MELNDSFVSNCKECIVNRQNVIINVAKEPKILIKEELNSYCTPIVSEIKFRFDARKDFDEFKGLFHFANAQSDDFLCHITFSSERLEDRENLDKIIGLNCCAITGDVTI